MPLTQTKRIVYGMFGQVVLLLVLYAAVGLLTAVKFLPVDPLAEAITYGQAATFGNITLNLALLTGLLAGGLYIVVQSRPDGMLKRESVLRRVYQAWTIVIGLALIGAAFGQTEGRHLLELPPLLDVAVAVLIVLFVVLAGQSLEFDSLAQRVDLRAEHGTGRALWNGFTLVWACGMLLSAVCTVIGLIPAADIVQDRVLRTLAVNVNLNVAFVLAAVGIGFWLMGRFSSVSSTWAEAGAYHVGGMLAVAGALVSLAPIAHLPGAISAVGGITFFVAPLLYVIFAAHSYRALADRHPTRTLAAHWYTLALVLLFAGVGILGGVTSVPGIQRMAQGTRLTDLQYSLTAFGVMAMILALINQAVAEMRGQNARITGLLPFWLVAFGMVAGGLALAFAGVIQVYLERLLSMGYLDTQAALVPLYILWLICLFCVAAGLAIYALGFRARRIRE
jgi:nitric oxide reductase subunit B